MKRKYMEVIRRAADYYEYYFILMLWALDDSGLFL